MEEERIEGPVNNSKVAKKHWRRAKRKSNQTKRNDGSFDMQSDKTKENETLANIKQVIAMDTQKHRQIDGSSLTKSLENDIQLELGEQSNRDNGGGAPNKQSNVDIPNTSNNSLEDREIEHACVKDPKRHSDMHANLASREKDITRWGDEVEGKWS